MAEVRFRRGLDRYGGWWVVEVDGRSVGKVRRVRGGFDPVWEARRFPGGEPVYRPGRGLRTRAEAVEALIAETDVKST